MILPLEEPPEPLEEPPEPFEEPPDDSEEETQNKKEGAGGNVVPSDEEMKKIRKRMAQNKRIRELKAKKKIPKKHYLMITRFNSFTHDEMLDYCKTIKGVQCIYGVPRLVSNFINPEGIMFVLEMNNDINKIMGIGMVRNVPVAGKHRIYEEENYNRYAYLGKTRIAREQMNEDEEELFKTLDKHCFKGATHQKRGQGINFFPPNLLEDGTVLNFIITMFKARIIRHE